MKLKHKAALVIGTSTLAFLACTSFAALRIPWLTHALVTIAFGVSIYLASEFFLLKRIRQLEVALDQQDIEHPIPLAPEAGEDEITEITSQVNNLITAIQANSKHFNQEVHERTVNLEQDIERLKSEVTAHRLTERRLQADKDCLTQIAKYDDLTSLPNRVFFNEILNKSLNHARRRQKHLAILLIDLDRFGQISSQLGQAKCDIISKEIGKRLTSSLRTEDVVAKLDEDEFGILLNDIGKPKFASTVAEKILAVCSQPMKVDDFEFSLTASIGICIYPNDGLALEDLLRNADSALYKAKQGGGNNYQFHTDELDLEAREYIQLGAALREALNNNELILYYQPKLRVRDGNITSVESLMRWEHPALGIIQPSKFIPLAEETGLIMKIGEWAIREACRTAKYWQDEGYQHISVSVNLSTRQFHHPDTPKMIANALRMTGLNPQYLEFEINEHTVMDNMELSTAILENIKNTGVKISIDHFGTGYTSISHLKQIPVSAIKIDQTFIRGVPNNPDDCAIVQAIISLAHHLGLEVIAEGVESAEQVMYLSELNCDLVQGYFLSHPQSAQKVVSQFTKLRDEALV